MILPYVYDAGALIALDRQQRSSWVRHQVAIDDGRRVVVPSVVVGQVWRGSARQHFLARILSSCEIVPVDDGTARRAGELCGAADSSDIVDAAVVTIALENGPTVIWTGDPGDLERLRRASPDPGRLLIRAV